MRIRRPRRLIADISLDRFYRRTHGAWLRTGRVNTFTHREASCRRGDLLVGTLSPRARFSRQRRMMTVSEQSLICHNADSRVLAREERLGLANGQLKHADDDFLAVCFRSSPFAPTPPSWLNRRRTAPPVSERGGFAHADFRRLAIPRRAARVDGIRCDFAGAILPLDDVRPPLRASAAILYDINAGFMLSRVGAAILPVKMPPPIVLGQAPRRC